VKNTLLARWQANFWAGLATVLPAAVTFIVLLWLFKTVGSLTDPLLFFLPRAWTHGNKGEGEMYWYWSLLAVVIAVFLIGIVGLVARNYFGKRLIEWIDAGLLKVPLLNKIYAATKQVNDAFSPQNKTAFRTVVAIEYPKAGVYTLGFITNDEPKEAQEKLREKLVCVFVPTTPNPTAGFLLFVPEDKVTKLDMSVADGIKYVISLGSIVPEYSPGSKRLPAPAAV
jgi:uncharacterized membrane protein